MYILEVNHGGGEIHRHFLLPGQTYTLGRKECRILLPAAEPSISRHHATIVVAPMPRYSVLDPTAQLEVRIEDVSKHGTFVDRERVGKDNSRFLYPEDRIRLGLRVTARVIPMVLVLGISPDLTDKSLDAVLDSAVSMGALVVEDAIPPPLRYYERHTNCVGFLYVAEDAFAMEETMMQALGYGYTLVTPDYVMRLVRSLTEKDTLMPSEFPVPSSPAPASVGLRAVHYRRPAQTFFSVTEFLSAGKPIVANVFRGYTFLVVDEVIREGYAAVLAMFDGVVEVLTTESVGAWCDRQPRTGSCPLTTVVLVTEDDFRVISEAVMERGGGRGAFTTAHTRPTIAAYLTLYRCGVCVIPEENVHLALYRSDGAELNTKSSACYLQRTSEDVVADAASATTPTAAEPDAAAAAATASGTTAAAPAHQRESPSPSRKEHSASRVMEPVMKSPPAPPTITHAPPVNARRSRELSYLSALASSPRAESADRNASTATASPVNPPVIAKSSSPRASSPAQAAAAPTATIPAVHTSGSATPSCATSTSVSATTTTTAPADATSAAGTAPPPTLDADKLASHTIASSFANAGRSNSSSTAPPGDSSVVTSTSATPTAGVKSTANATGSEGRTVEAANSTTASDAPATTAAAPSSPLAEEASNTAARDAPPETSVSVGRCRLVGPRASHPFSLGLRARLGETHNADDDDGEAPENGSPANGTSKRASVIAEAASEEAEEGAAAAAATSNAASSSSSQSRRPTSASLTRRASASGRRASVGAQPSPVILPLKSEEVVRPRSRAASGSQPASPQQQTAYAAAIAALGRRSGALSEERPPLPPAEDVHHLISMEEAQRRSSGSTELSTSQGIPPLPPPSPSATNAPHLQQRSATKANNASAAPAAGAGTTAAAAGSAAGNQSAPAPSTTATTAAAAAAAPEKVVTGGSSGTTGPSSTAAAPTHASVRRGEQRLASASVPTPRRSLVRVNPMLAAIQHERSASPQQSVAHAKLKRFTTPERDVVVHGATQVGKSPPRQRVEAVRINASERRSSVSRDPEASFSRHGDTTEEDAAPAGSMGNRRSVLRRESVSAVNRPPPLSGGPLTRRASSSFHRSDSAQLREMATPHRLTTSRISSSVPRTRRSKAYGSVQRQRSPEPGAEDAAAGGMVDSEATEASVLTNPGPLAQRASIRRRRGSPTQTATTRAGAAAAAGGGSTGASGSAVPGQIPGLRGSSAAPVLGGTSNATAETYFRINDELNTHCQRFMKDFVDDFMSETERVTRSVVRQTYMDAPSKETLEGGVERILEFLQYVNSTEPDIPSMYSTSSTRAACHQVRQKSQYVLSKIKACYKTVNCKVPSSLTRARAALSTRNVSPTQRRLASVSGANEGGAAVGRRQSTF